MRRAIRWLYAAPIRLYQLIVSPLFPANCNYFPTCSEYARIAIQKHGIVRGTIMGAMRIGRCSAWYHGGNDDVPVHFDLSALRDEYRERRVHKNG